MFEFLIILALIWLVFASVSDLKKREVPNWLNFSLIIFALAYRVIYSILNNEFGFLIYGLFGLIVFVILAYAFYYARIFAGGDAKLLMGLGAVLPFASSFYSNLLIFGAFIFLLLAVGGVYGLIYSAAIAFKNKKKFSDDFCRQLKKRKGLIVLAIISALLVFVVYYSRFFITSPLFILPLIILVFPFLFIYAKVAENFMIAKIEGKNVTVGDWLAEKIKIKGRLIKPYWEGLSEKEVALIKKSGKKVKIKFGIPFVPAIFSSFVLLIALKDYLLSFLI